MLRYHSAINRSPAMPRPILLVLALMLATPAGAADLPARSRIGVIFAEPEVVVRAAPPQDPALLGFPIFAPQVDIPPLVNGYYGKPNSYYYSSYYGTSPLTIFTRLPYACGFHGYC
jgi:hypothetical protein